MKELIVNLLQDVVLALKDSGVLPVDTDVVVRVDRPKDKKHGDFATNLALVLAGRSSLSARELADIISAKFADVPEILKTEVAGPGFVNFFLNDADKNSIVKKILAEKEQFGSCNLGCGEKLLLEFVSANPTGPLHVGHGRFVGNACEFAGFCWL